MKDNKFCKNCALNEERTEKTGHVQITGMAMYDTHEGKRFVQIEPAVALPGMMQPYSGTGKIMVMSDGSMEAILAPRKRSESELLLKLPHGRLSRTKQGMLQLTLIYHLEEDSISAQMHSEAYAAASFLTPKC